MGLPLLALAIAAFGIGTTEFVIMGLLPEVAADLAVTIPAAGMLVSAYALGVTIGGPILALLTARLPRKSTLAVLMVLFIVGNLGCALAPNYMLLMVARVVTAFCHAAFFGIGAVVAASLVEPSKRAQAMAMMFTGLTLANVLGVPLGTLLGQATGWRATFAGVVVIGIVALLAVLRWVPSQPRSQDDSLIKEMGVLRNRQVLMALGMSVLASTSMFTLFTYISPILREVSGIAPQHVGGVLLLVGLGLTVGNLVGGRLADWKQMPSLLGGFSLIALVLVLFAYASAYTVPAIITLVLWGAIAFGACTPLQARVVSQAGSASSLASTLNISAFNLGNALGAWLGGAAISQGTALRHLPLIAALAALAGLLLTISAALLERRVHRSQARLVEASA
ncbi:MFS transporter [Chitinimonas naiadis]